MRTPPVYTPKFPKTTDGLVQSQRRTVTRTKHVSAEDAAKRAAKRRDGNQCRWPHCAHRAVRQPLDGAHVAAKGMGGTPDGRRNVRENLIAVCRLDHKGPYSLHSGDLRIVPRTKQGTDGPCDFYRRTPAGRWVRVERETAIRQYEPMEGPHV